MTNREAMAIIEEHKRIHKMKEPRAVKVTEALDLSAQALAQIDFYKKLTKCYADLINALLDVIPQKGE